MTKIWQSFPDEIFDQHAAIVGRTGSGKSYAARGLVEKWLEQRRRVCIIDPTDVWYGLRSNPAGDGPGFPVAIFGGGHADVEIGERSGERLAEIIASRNLPAVIATAEMTSGERHRFMTDFLGTLYRLNKTPLHLVLDEADDVAPQNPLPENRRMLGDVERIVRRGRVRGFRVTMITQRSAVLNKNILTQASTLVALRLPAKQDRDAIEGWIKGQADETESARVLSSLSRLPRGEGWIWAPEQGILTKVPFPQIRTFDSMRTPEHGESVGEPTQLAPVELGDLSALLTPAAETNATSAASRAAIEEAERRGYGRGRLRGFGDAIDHLRERREEWRERIEALRRDVDAFFTGAGVPIGDGLDVQPLQGEPGDEGGGQPKTKGEPSATSGLPSSAVKMLSVLARGLELTWVQTATLSGLKARGGHFNAGRKALRDADLVTERGDIVAISPAGIDAAGGAQSKPETPAELLSWWRSVLPKTSGRILDQLVRQENRPVSPERLAAFLSLQPRGGHWNSSLSILRVNGLIEIRDNKLKLRPFSLLLKGTAK